MKKVKFCESFDTYMDNIEYFSIWEQSRADFSWTKIMSNQILQIILIDTDTCVVNNT